MSTPIRYASYVTFVGLLASLWLNLLWPWGVLFLFWVFVSIRKGEAFLLGPISRRQEPVFFWFVILLWTALSVVMIVGNLL